MIQVLDNATGDGWAALNVDCVSALQQAEPESIDYSIYSIPFQQLFCYTASERDFSNTRNREEFFEQYKFLLRHMYRATKPGRLHSVHAMDLPSSKQNDGFIGLKDFPGDIIRAAQEAGWIWHSKVTIKKDPIRAMQRTKALGLLWKQILKDSCMSRMGIPDYVLTFRKPGVNPDRVSHTKEEFPVTYWQKLAEPIWDENDGTELFQEYYEALARMQTWDDIDESDTLQVHLAREAEDARHLCPLQLGVIRKCLQLWSKPGDLVCSPFMGIGSEGYVALQMDRRFFGCEIKEAYFKVAVKNLRTARRQTSLFSLLEKQENEKYVASQERAGKAYAEEINLTEDQINA